MVRYEAPFVVKNQSVYDFGPNLTTLDINVPTPSYIILISLSVFAVVFVVILTLFFCIRRRNQFLKGKSSRLRINSDEWEVDLIEDEFNQQNDRRSSGKLTFKTNSSVISA